MEPRKTLTISTSASTTTAQLSPASLYMTVTSALAPKDTTTRTPDPADQAQENLVEQLYEAVKSAPDGLSVDELFERFSNVPRAQLISAASKLDPSKIVHQKAARGDIWKAN